MSLTSLRVRLLLAWAVFTALILGLTDIGLRFLFERSITRRTQTELTADARQIRRGMEFLDGKVEIVRKPSDPQFDILFGGRYWQVSDKTGVLQRSASLGNEDLPIVGPPVEQQDPRTFWTLGPEGQRLFAVSTSVSVGKPDHELRMLTITTAVDGQEISDDTDKFSSDLHTSIVALAAVLLLAAWVQVTVGLRPLEQLRSRVSAVRSGATNRIDGEYPDEVMPLVLETNELLTAQEQQIRLARERAADLAHGLKTPLAVMAAKSRQLGREGLFEISAEIDRQIHAMARHVEHELARSRTRGAGRSPRSKVDIAELTDAIVSVVQGLPRSEPLNWDCELAARIEVAIDPEDFNTVAGNLIENAQKWARSKVRVRVVHAKPGEPALIVEDDGAGVAEKDMDRILLRGERADDSVDGSGLGLAIAREIIESYGGLLKLSRSELGGLKAVACLHHA